MKNAANSITNAISIVLYCILHNTIQFKVAQLYLSMVILCKAAGPARVRFNAKYAQVPVVGVPVCLSGLVPMLMPSANKIKNEIKKVEEEWCKLAKMKKNNNHGKVC